MDRTLVKDTINKVGETVELMGWIQTRRDHGKIIFLDLVDRTGLVQVVTTETMANVGDAVSINGLVKSRPEKLVNTKILTGKIEIEAKKIAVIGKSETYPFDMGKETLDLELPTLLDHRSLTLRHPSVKTIFKVQEKILAAFRAVAQELDCTEIVVPTIVPASTEGGADVFPIDYFGSKAFLSQSPQLYKQMLVPVFERVFTICKAYRAEPSVTTRHLTESTQMDCEFCFVNFEELLDLLELVGTKVLQAVDPKVLVGKIPRLKLREAQEIIYKEFGRDVRGEKDLAPQDELDLGTWALKTHHSDFVTITHFPTKKRAFYTKPDPSDPEFSLSYDLLFRGLEILSGSQRINDHDELVKTLKNRGLDPKNFAMYLMAFKYGMPPEGGFSFGLERMTKNILNLENVRQAALFPRDLERVDMRLSSNQNLKTRDVFAEIKTFLDENKIKYQLFEHEPVFTSEQAAHIRGTELKQGAKALVMFADNKPIMIVLPADRKVDTSLFKKIFEIADLRMATKDEVKKTTNVEIGAVPPFGNLFKLPLYVDNKLGENKEIAFNAGEHTKSIKMRYEDFAKITNPIFGNFSS